jgi:copper chaperone CopZ
MKNRFEVFGAVLLLVAGSTYAGGNGENRRDGIPAVDSPAEGTAIITIAIEGMNGVVTAAVIEEALVHVDGVRSAEVSYQARRATVEVNLGRVHDEILISVIEEMGPFQARLLPAHTLSTTIRVPDLDSPEIGHEVNAVLANISGIRGGMIRTGFLAVDYDRRQVDPEAIAEAIATRLDLDTSEIAIPARDEPAPDESAQAVIRISGMNDYAAFAGLAQRVTLEGIVDAAVDTDRSTLTLIYVIDDLTTPEIMEVVEAEAPGEVELVTIDKAGKWVGLNVHGWFVMAVSALGLAVVLAGFALFRRSEAPR